jgi:hypothetical protein
MRIREQRIDEDRIVELNSGYKRFIEDYEIEAFAADHTPDCIGFLMTYDEIRICIIPEAN